MIRGKVRPIGDRLICHQLPVKKENRSEILTAFGEHQDTKNSGTRLLVTAVSKAVAANGDIKVGDVIIIGRRAFLNVMRTRDLEGEECYILHESDVDGLDADGL